MRISLLFVMIFLGIHSFAQKGVTTFGIQVKPIIPSKYFETGSITVPGESTSFGYNSKLGWNFGMVIRKGFTKNISLETGINMVRRNYSVSNQNLTDNTFLETEFAFVSYEIPVKALFYVQLSDELWMNAAGGASFAFYPSNIYSNAFDSRDTLNYQLEQNTFRNSWVQISILANLGLEYRTKDKGYYYFGVSYHQPFSDMAQTKATYSLNGSKESVVQNLSGSYLTFDLRYFFHEKPER